MDAIDKVRRIVDDCQSDTIDGTLVDLFTASAIIAVYDRLNERNRKTLAAKKIGTMAHIALKLANR